MKIRVLMVVVAWLALLACGCSDSETERREQTTPEAAEKIVIYVVNYPLAYFAGRVGGDQVTVEFPAPRDVDPAFWSPDADAVSAYQNADLILLNGANYAKWVDKVSLPQAKVVDTSKGFGDRYIVSEGAVTHSHGPGGEHAHTGTAFTTWLDFDQAVQQARAIKDALTERWPDRAESWQSGFAALERDLMELDSALQNAVAANASQAVIASHPVYQYLERRYGLNIESVLWEPDGFPTDGQWRELSHLVEDHGAKWMIWEGDPLPDSVKGLSEMSLGSVVFNPCGNAPEAGDFLTVMRSNIERIKKAYQ
jgi:zinc transport system substrate-binding protein